MNDPMLKVKNYYEKMDTNAENLKKGNIAYSPWYLEKNLRIDIIYNFYKEVCIKNRISVDDIIETLNYIVPITESVDAPLSDK
jgi:hypothetical protein